MTRDPDRALAQAHDQGLGKHRDHGGDQQIDQDGGARLPHVGGNAGQQRDRRGPMVRCTLTGLRT